MKKQIIIPVIVSTAIVAVVAAVLIYSYRNSTHTNIIASTSNSSSSSIPQTPPNNVPLGAYAGDIIGSVYEFNNTNLDPGYKNKFNLFDEKNRDINKSGAMSCFTDDSVLTCAMMEALLNITTSSSGVIYSNFPKYLYEYPRKKWDLKRGGFGGYFSVWYNKDLGDGIEESIYPPAYGSFGNGSAMRVSPVAWFFLNLDDVLHFAKLSADPTHNHLEGIKGAQATAAAIFLARKKYSREYIQSYIEENFYSDFMIFDNYKDKLKNGEYQNETCQVTVPVALYIALTTKNFEEAMREALSVGGDSDTIADIAGAVSEALCGMPQNIRDEAWRRLPDHIKEVSIKFGEKIKEKDSSINCVA